jgi:hypothetical protein
MRNNSNNSILFIKRLQRFKTTATLSGSWVPKPSSIKKFYHSYLRIELSAKAKAKHKEA